MAQVKIDKDVPIPTHITKIPKYPWREMEIGDSFLLETKESGATFAGQASKRLHPKKSISRKTDEGYRVWRVK